MTFHWLWPEVVAAVAVVAGILAALLHQEIEGRPLREFLLVKTVKTVPPTVAVAAVAVVASVVVKVDLLLAAIRGPMLERLA
jgi:hypothetical protein